MNSQLSKLEHLLLIDSEAFLDLPFLTSLYINNCKNLHYIYPKVSSDS